MRLGFFVNDVATELAIYTTTRLAQTATNCGDEVWYFSATDFNCETLAAAVLIMRQDQLITSIF